ncbi:class I tRNA ligase family protein [Candidatus Saccharibacteria bacterium]|nr:class I tRNA ligase family protein [Candidatus Saccharibacteria bacterium]
MKFTHGTRRRAAEYEKDWVQRWKDDRTFQKSVAQRPADNAYVFYDGPPFITGVPHHGTLLSSIVKDAVPRYWTMKGKRVERRWGWDCHGLPAENFVEKQLNIVDRRQIVTSSDQPAPLDKDGNPLPTISLEKYIIKARESMVANSETWQGVIDRIGRWVDFTGAYRTMDKDFMESVWWAFKQLYEAGKIYEGEKVLMYDTKFATPVSKAEVTMDNDAYQTVTDPSVYVKFSLMDEDAAVLAWTTTPWTLPANLMLAVNPEMTYCEVKVPKGTKNVFLLSGKHAYASRQYYPQLKQQLEQQGYTVTIIDHIDPDSPDLAENVEQLAQYDFANAHVVTHSLGAATFLKYLQDANVTVASLTMIAPAYGVSNSSDEQWKQESGYVGLVVDLAQVRRKIAQRPTIIYSDDAEVLNQGFAQLGKELGAAMQYEPGKGHFFAAEKSLVPEIILPLSEKLIIAEEALERTLQDEKHQPLDYDVLRKFPGSELVGKTYQPLDTGSAWPENDKIHTIYAADFVSHESGTGIVHIAPAYGEDDFELAKRHGISAFHVIDDNGYYTDSNYTGLEVWDNNKFIAKDLKEKGAVWKIEYIRHEYPFNPRSKQRIMYRAIPSWFFDIQGQKPLMLEQNEHINWFPSHLKHGRFAKNIEQAPDWNLSRDRFWATAMPVWKGDRGTVKVVGSYAELKELSGVELDDYHRPWVDDITFEIDGETFTRIDKVLDCWFESGSMPFAQLHYPFENQAKFEQNYPADFIVEYIGQVRAWFYYVHAVNAALAEIGAFGEAGVQHKNAYSNVITTGVVAGNDGRKMSKSLGNFTDPNELMDKFSADSLRFLLLSSPLLNGEDFALHDKDVGDVARKLAMIWNMYDFFTMYAEVDGWEFDGRLVDPLSGKPVCTSLSSTETASAHRESRSSTTGDTAELAALKQSSYLPDVDNLNSRARADVSDDEATIGAVTNPLDIWIISRLHELVAEVERQMDAYNIPDALSPILPFLDDASNWYVRRSRRRFWKSEDDGDKSDAYRTLHYVLVRLSHLLAPFTPFLAEELYHNLTGDDEAIHLKDWLPAGAVDEQVLADMETVKDIVSVALHIRSKAGRGYGSRQPLSEMRLYGVNPIGDYSDILKDEVNVQKVTFIQTNELSKALDGMKEPSGTEGTRNYIFVTLELYRSPELKREGLMREVIRHVQSARKKAGLQVDDRIVLHLAVGAEPTSQPAAPGQAQLAGDTAAQLRQALAEHADTIASETLATMAPQQPGDALYHTTATVDGAELQVSLAKA